MVIGVVRLEFFLPYARSLKDKRMFLQSLKDRLRSRFNVAIAELGFHDVWQRAQVGIVTLNAERGFVEKVMNAVLRDIEAKADAEIVGRSLEYL
ncbi:MAG: DUF503 domain-containing protein [Candidatus Aminicenantes bacterium]|nr:DUF503 domain-containing protein [Candidatus Aminicenantes bacterium]